MGADDSSFQVTKPETLMEQAKPVEQSFGVSRGIAVLRQEEDAAASGSDP